MEILGERKTKQEDDIHKMAKTEIGVPNNSAMQTKAGTGLGRGERPFGNARGVLSAAHLAGSAAVPGVWAAPGGGG
jgi:hypothetical protein